MKVYLDDERTAPYGWIRAETSDAAIFLLKHRNVNEISLDHDLGHEDAGTGYDVLLWIEEQLHTREDFKLPKIYIHTANPSARVKMESAVENMENYFINKNK